MTENQRAVTISVSICLLMVLFVVMCVNSEGCQRSIDRVNRSWELHDERQALEAELIKKLRRQLQEEEGSR